MSGIRGVLRALAVAATSPVAAGAAAAGEVGVAPVDSVVTALRAAHDAGDGVAFLELIDRAIYDDLVGGIPPAERPARPPVDAARLMASLETGTVFLALHPRGDEVFALSVTADALASASLDSPMVEPLSRRRADWCADPVVRPFDSRAAYSVWEGLVSPLVHDQKRVRRLVVSSSGALAGVPLEILLLTPVDPYEPARGPWAGSRYEIALEPTPGAHLAWAPSTSDEVTRRLPTGPDGFPEPTGAPIAAGDLVVGGGAAGRPAALLALRLCRSGARAALLGPFPGGDSADYLVDYPRARLDRRRSDVSVVAGLKRRARRADLTLLPEAWAFPLLYGAR